MINENMRAIQEGWREKLGKWIADDGTVCESKEDMLRMNAAIEKLLLPDHINKVFGWWFAVESNGWFTANIARRGLSIVTYAQAVKGYV